MFLNGKKILYHGTIYQHDVIDLSKCKKYGDFGAGYYLTTLFNQAYTWAKNKSHGNYYVYKYSLHQFPQNNIRILPLLQYNLEWLNTIAYCRLLSNLQKNLLSFQNIV